MTDNYAYPPIIDPRQLVRIEAVHRGYLYQHLYAAECLLRAGRSETNGLVTERDEDVELRRPDHHLYIQVKTRAQSLAPADILEAIDRFAVIRREHESGSRQGSARFLIACNVPLSPKLAEMVADAAWPSDVEVNWPDGPDPGPGIPRPARDVGAAIQSCVAAADGLPFALLRPDTLVWKLAGAVMLAASGSVPRQDHAFTREELPVLFEQLIVQMQQIPAPPAVYRSQVDEPSLVSGAAIRIITGLSGAGKTAWVAQAAVHSTASVAYLDVADIPGAALASTVARDLAARTFGRSRETLGEVLLPGASPLETLGALNTKLGQDGIRSQVVLDNAHQLRVEDVRAVVERASNIQFLLLCQPGQSVSEFEAAFAILSETLGGWDEDTIAAAIADEGCRADYEACEQLARLTGALPFYVINAATVGAREYGGNIAAFCNDLESQTHTVALAQETILGRAFRALSQELADTIGVLSLADIAISRDDALSFLRNALDISERDAATRLRALPYSGMLETFGNAGLKIHDSVRPIGREHIASRGNHFERVARRTLRDLLLGSIQRNWSVAKLRLLVRLYSQLGEAKTLVQFATDELFHELGVWPEIEPNLIATAQNLQEDPEVRFWALDGLVFNDLHVGNLPTALPRIDAMKSLLNHGGLQREEWLSWAMKYMLVLTTTGDVTAVEKMSDEVEAHLPARAEHRRIFRYNRALAFFQLGQYAKAAEAVEPLIDEYYDVLGIGPEDVTGRNAPELRRILPRGRDQTDDLKHLADTLDLHAQALDRSGGQPRFQRIHALKFYELAHAPQSSVRVGQDLVDEFVKRRDFIGAKDALEKLVLPVVQGMGLVSWVVPVRAQHAVVLAYCGDHEGAAAEMARLKPYEAGMDEAERAQLRGQRELVEQLRRYGPPPQAQIVIPPEIQEFYNSRKSSVKPVEAHRKIGRNERCPCGSGRKFKHCHGR